MHVGGEKHENLEQNVLISVKILLQKDINIYHSDYKKIQTDMSSTSHLLFFLMKV